jgi:hypothetical protein
MHGIIDVVPHRRGTAGQSSLVDWITQYWPPPVAGGEPILFLVPRIMDAHFEQNVMHDDDFPFFDSTITHYHHLLLLLLPI